jgi:hypothetical protein
MFPEAPELHLHPYRSKDRVALIQIERTWTDGQHKAHFERTWATQGDQARKVPIKRTWTTQGDQASKEGPDQSGE